MEKNISTRDDSISFVRLVAMSFIVVCHFLQYYGNFLSNWFNVGVQIFLFMSGYLYANRIIDDEISFIKRNFIKILVPYYIFVIFASIIGLLFSHQCKIIDVIKLILLFSSGDYQGLANVWFIPFILLCYLMTPSFLKWMKHLENKKSIMGLFFTIVGLAVYFGLFNSYYTAAWMLCYFSGIIIGRLLDNNSFLVGANNKERGKIVKCLVYISALSTSGFRVFIDYIQKISFAGSIAELYEIYRNYSHALLGIALFFVIRDIYTIISKYIDVSRPIRMSDKYSYCVYLVHQFFILGDFSVCRKIATNKVLAISTVLLLIGISAKLLYEVSEVAKRKIKVKNRNIT